ncbi:MAG: Do family serine endopeptidase [Bacteroidales bacterium]|nr:Do family serine endopeptidase [Bacteroidales bacterium]
MKIKYVLGSLVIAVAGALAALVIYTRFFQKEPKVVEVPSMPAARYANLPAPEGGQNLDFTVAVEKSIHAVVHVKTKVFREYPANPLYEFFFGTPYDSEPTPILGFGSGVIITKDGYIVTNNHVIDGSDEIMVALNDKREIEAKLIGTDPTTDLALLKIDAEGLSFLDFGNSDALRLGEWVLAIGNPYNLTSTVTAGIVSAKARNINILRGDLSIESFIQTDAAVNPGNSGGALVNTDGKLVGINTAIASRTGAYTGYSFAIPVSIVSKVVEDLLEFGAVQRAILGVTIQDVNSELAKELDITELEGVYVNGLQEGGAAKSAGIKAGDIIVAINDVRVNSVSELQEQISRYRPNDKVRVLLKRDDNKLRQFDVVLRNTSGSTEIVRQDDMVSLLGAGFGPVSDREKRMLGITNGVKVTSVQSGKFMKVGIREGFIVTFVNKKPVNSVKDITDILKDAEGGVIIEGVYEDGSRSYYAFGM